jgi:hypothetical protein
MLIGWARPVTLETLMDAHGDLAVRYSVALQEIKELQVKLPRSRFDPLTLLRNDAKRAAERFEASLLRSQAQALREAADEAERAAREGCNPEQIAQRLRLRADEL